MLMAVVLRTTHGRGSSELEAVDVAGRRNVRSECADEVKGPRVKAEGDPQQKNAQVRRGGSILDVQGPS